MKLTYSLLLLILIATSACGKSNENQGSGATPPPPSKGKPSVKDTIADSAEPTPPPPVVTPTITLNDAIDMMLEESAEIKKANERVKEFSYYTDIAKKKLFPSVQATLGYSYSSLKPGSQSYYVGFSQVIWDGKYKPEVKLNVMRQMAEEQRARAIHRAMIVGTVNKYLNLIKSQGGVTSATIQYNTVKKVRDQVLTASALGLLDPQIKYEAEAAFANATLNLQAATGEADIACANLLMAIGKFSSKELCETPEHVEPPVLNLPASKEEAIKLALEKRPEIAIDLALIESTKAGVSLARADFYPKIVVGVNVGVTDNPYAGGNFGGGASGGFQNDKSVTVGVTIDLFDGGKKKKAMAAAASKVKQAEQDLELTRELVTMSVLTDIINLDKAQKGIKAAEAGEISAQNSYKLSLIAYRLGGKTLTDVLNNLSTYAKAQQQTLEARYNLVQSIVNLKTSLGIEME